MTVSPVTLKNTNLGQDLFISPPTLGLRGRIRVPGDKSISHRALMLGAIAHGETQIHGLLLGDDPRSTVACFRAMGVKISNLESHTVVVQGVGIDHLQEPSDILNAGNSGTTLRLMLGLLAAQPGKFFTITGDQSLRSRPMMRVIQPLEQMGARIWHRRNGLAPMAVQGQPLQPIHYTSPIASAQVKSCILLAGLLTAGQTTVTEPALSRDHSERMLQAFGAQLTIDPDTCSVTLCGPAQLQGQSVVVPGDISSAAFWLVAAAILPDSDLVVENVGVNPTRTGILEVLTMMDAHIEFMNQRTVAGEPVADLRIRYRTDTPLKACRIGGDLIPRLVDEIPILSVAAIFAKGVTVIEDAAELRVKESDRLAVMATQLTQMGAIVRENPDGLEITGSGDLKAAELDSHGDHRIAMSLAIAALRARGCTTIHQAEAATVSYPDFFSTLSNLTKF
ncbi:MAG: 3-phosphoshikimate 1-carboxyvinyltransferase [Synechococcales cyanobacterium]